MIACKSEAMGVMCQLEAGHDGDHRDGAWVWQSVDPMVEWDTAPTPSALTFTEYADEVLKYGVYPESHRVTYPALGLAGEAGEVADQIKKAIRDDGGKLTDARRAKVLAELGDVLWYVAATAADCGSSLEEIAQMNREKLAVRNARGLIHGDGSER